MKNDRSPFNFASIIVVISTHDYHLKKMPGRTGRMEARVYVVPSLAGDAGFTAQRHRNGVLL
ncbi:TPA: hypothetical protein I4G32_07755 [Enterobacter hormaechei subsp. oharae]|nr:hypothetical protein [Enterobacter hormaechei subsp. oharae]HAS1749759.1 hypothetical protein [Enterobacter hormaechei subsp. oharae]